MAVTVGSSSILHDAVAEVRSVFPGATLNQVLRLAAMTAVKGEREARRIVFSVSEDIRVMGDRLPLALTPAEKSIIAEAKRENPDLTQSEAVRYGLAKLAREDDDDKIGQYVERKKTGRHRKSPVDSQ